MPSASPARNFGNPMWSIRTSRPGGRTQHGSRWPDPRILFRIWSLSSRSTSMPVEFIGYVGTQEVSEIIPPSEPAIDTDYARAVALAHEAGGFDRVLMAHSSASPDAVVTAAQVFAD